MFRLRPLPLRSTYRSSGTYRPWTQPRCAHSLGRPKGQMGGHWTAEKLATSDEYPLSGALTTVTHPRLMPPKKKVRNARSSKSAFGPATRSAVTVRTQIVSPGLCGMLFLGKLLQSACTPLTLAI
jgi:hypothetical protein